MSSLQIPKDIDILRYCLEPHFRFEIAKKFGLHYASLCQTISRLENMGYLFVIEKKKSKGKIVKYFLITDKGRAILRGFKEANRI